MSEGLDEVFSDIARFAANCRFGDCAHETEPGCAVRAAIDAGDLDAGRLRRFRKLQSEDRRNTETLAERRSRDKNFGKMIKSVLSDKQKERGGKYGGN